MAKLQAFLVYLKLQDGHPKILNGFLVQKYHNYGKLITNWKLVSIQVTGQLWQLCGLDVASKCPCPPKSPTPQRKHTQKNKNKNKHTHTCFEAARAAKMKSLPLKQSKIAHFQLFFCEFDRYFLRHPLKNILTLWDSLVRAVDTKKLNDFPQKDTQRNIWETLATTLFVLFSQHGFET